MLTHAPINRIGLTVSSYQASVRFYTRMLGLSTLWENAVLKSAGFQAGANLVVLQEGKTGGASGGIRIYFSVTNIEVELNELRENGVACTAIRKYPDCLIVDFSDPDGNRLGIIENRIQTALDG